MVLGRMRQRDSLPRRVEATASGRWLALLVLLVLAPVPADAAPAADAEASAAPAAFETISVPVGAHSRMRLQVPSGWRVETEATSRETRVELRPAEDRGEHSLAYLLIDPRHVNAVRRVMMGTPTQTTVLARRRLPAPNATPDSDLYVVEGESFRGTHFSFSLATDLKGAPMPDGTRNEGLLGFGRGRRDRRALRRRRHAPRRALRARAALRGGFRRDGADPVHGRVHRRVRGQRGARAGDAAALGRGRRPRRGRDAGLRPHDGCRRRRGLAARPPLVHARSRRRRRGRDVGPRRPLRGGPRRRLGPRARGRRVRALCRARSAGVQLLARHDAARRQGRRA